MWLWGVEGREYGAGSVAVGRRAREVEGREWGAVRSLCGSATGNGAVWRERGACRAGSLLCRRCVARERGRGGRMGGMERGESVGGQGSKERGGAVGWRARAIKSRLFVRADGFGVGGEACFGMSAGRVCNGRVFLSGVRRPVDLRRTGTYVPAGSVFR